MFDCDHKQASGRPTATSSKADRPLDSLGLDASRAGAHWAKYSAAHPAIVSFISNSCLNSHTWPFLGLAGKHAANKRCRGSRLVVQYCIVCSIPLCLGSCRSIPSALSPLAAHTALALLHALPYGESTVYLFIAAALLIVHGPPGVQWRLAAIRPAMVCPNFVCFFAPKETKALAS